MSIIENLLSIKVTCYMISNVLHRELYYNYMYNSYLLKKKNIV